MTEDEWKRRYKEKFIHIMTTADGWKQNGLESALGWCDSTIDDACSACFVDCLPEDVAIADVNCCLTEYP